MFSCLCISLENIIYTFIDGVDYLHLINISKLGFSIVKRNSNEVNEIEFQH